MARRKNIPQIKQIGAERKNIKFAKSLKSAREAKIKNKCNQLICVINHEA